MVFKRFKDRQNTPMTDYHRLRCDVRRQHGPITAEDVEIVRNGYMRRHETLKPYSYAVSEANHICVRILYNTNLITSLDHFRPYFLPEFDFSRLHLRGSTLVVDIPHESWKYLKRNFQSANIAEVYRELNQYFTDAGIEEFFDEIRNVYLSFYNHEVQVQRKALEGVKRTLAIQQRASEQRQARELIRKQKREASDFREVRNHKARDLSRIGSV